MGRSGKEMKNGSCFILGLPAAGKTSYLAALAYSLEQTDIQTKFKWDKFTENHQYLAMLAETWARGEEVPRTNPGIEQERLRLQLLDEEGQVFHVIFPDLSGETFQKQYRSREMGEELAAQIADCGSIMLFINPENTKEPELISELPAHIRKEPLPEDSAQEPAGQDSLKGSPMEDAPANTASTEATPTAVQLVVLLQDILLLLENRELNPIPLAVIISAWDVVTDCENPEQCSKKRLPLLWQYLQTHKEQLKASYYGISAQGGRLNPEEETEQLLEKYSAMPAERILVIDSSGEQSHDITLPLWDLMSASVEI